MSSGNGPPSHPALLPFFSRAAISSQAFLCSVRIDFRLCMARDYPTRGVYWRENQSKSKRPAGERVLRLRFGWANSNHRMNYAHNASRNYKGCWDDLLGGIVPVSVYGFQNDGYRYCVHS